MRLTVRVLGLELLHVEASTEEDDAGDQAPEDRGVTNAIPVGFTASPGDQRWEKAPELS